MSGTERSPTGSVIVVDSNGFTNYLEKGRGTEVVIVYA